MNQLDGESDDLEIESSIVGCFVAVRIFGFFEPIIQSGRFILIIGEIFILFSKSRSER